VLAQTFTDAFTVFSAKRFPGVPGEVIIIIIPFGGDEGIVCVHVVAWVVVDSFIFVQSLLL
jgi:hypothetical protein